MEERKAEKYEKEGKRKSGSLLKEWLKSGRSERIFSFLSSNVIAHFKHDDFSNIYIHTHCTKSE